MASESEGTRWCGFPVWADDRVPENLIGFVKPGLPPKVLGVIVTTDHRSAPFQRPAPTLDGMEGK